MENLVFCAVLLALPENSLKFLDKRGFNGIVFTALSKVFDCIRPGFINCKTICLRFH